MFSSSFAFCYLQKEFYAGKSEAVTTKSQKEKESKSLKEKTTKAERRAMQEAQRASKAAAKGSCFAQYTLYFPFSLKWSAKPILMLSVSHVFTNGWGKEVGEKRFKSKKWEVAFVSLNCISLNCILPTPPQILYKYQARRINV